MMLHEIFYWLFNMSIAASLIGLIVLPLRKLKRLPRRAAVLLWIAPFLRMWVPIGLNSPYSLMSLLSKVATKTVVIFTPTDDLSFSMTNCVAGADRYFPITYKYNILEDIFSVAGIVWLVGFSAIALTLAILYFTTLHELKDAEPDGDGVYYSSKITSPAVYGIRRPRIILPISYRKKNIRYILLHERAHIKRGDNFWRILAFATVAVHWFNPLAWLFLKRFLSDLELACDERVIARMEKKEIRAYARSLLADKGSTNAFVSSFGGAAIRTRIESILSYRKMTWISVVCSLTLLLIILSVLLTNAA